MNTKKVGLILGPFLYSIVLLIHPFEELTSEANAVFACGLWMAVWWLTEAIPIAATSLLAIVILPLSGGAPIAQTTAAFGDKMLFLFMGGFVMAIAIQKWNLHKRIALSIIAVLGTNPSRIILGFMLATGLLSMWISNTATTLMMVTIASAMIAEIKDIGKGVGKPFFKSILLGVAYSASIGGVATLVGTPTNPIFVAVSQRIYETEIPFVDWMSFALPFSLLMLFIVWWLLTRLIIKIDKYKLPIHSNLIANELKKLGKITYEEKLIAMVFTFTALAWITRTFLLQPIIPSISDTVIAIAAAVLLFILRDKNGKPLLSWDEAERLPWGVIVLFGGGLSLAAAFQSSGLALWLGNQLTAVGVLPLFAIILMIACTVNFMTEVTSNVATASIMLPVLATLADGIGVHPYYLMIPATMAASCAFMLPIATAPNAIVFSSGELEIRDMMKTGFWLNVFSSVLISLLVYFVLPIFL